MPRTARYSAGEIRFRGSPKDHARLARLARHYETTPSDVLRRLIAEAALRLKAAVKGERESKTTDNKE